MQGVKGTHEESVERESDDIGGQGQHHEVDFPVLGGHLESLESALIGIVRVGLSYVLDHSQLSEFLLDGRETSGVGREIRKDEDCGNRHQHGHSACPSAPSLDSWSIKL